MNRLNQLFGASLLAVSMMCVGCQNDQNASPGARGEPARTTPAAESTAAAPSTGTPLAAAPSTGAPSSAAPSSAAPNPGPTAATPAAPAEATAPKAPDANEAKPAANVTTPAASETPQAKSADTAASKAPDAEPAATPAPTAPQAAEPKPADAAAPAVTESKAPMKPDQSKSEAPPAKSSEVPGAVALAKTPGEAGRIEGGKEASPPTAIAHIHGAGDNKDKISGTVTFIQEGDGVQVVVDVTGLTPGKHGFHIHDKPDLSAPDLTSAGGHWNPEGHPHGDPADGPHHAGDMGNLTADEHGHAKETITLKGISVHGKEGVVGHSVIIHAKADDLKSQPAGDAGPRVAGGVIESSPGGTTHPAK